MAADQVRGLVAHVGDDGIARLLDLRANGRLEVHGRPEVRVVRHHVELGVAVISGLAEIALSCSSLGARTTIGRSSPRRWSDAGSLAPRLLSPSLIGSRAMPASCCPWWRAPAMAE